MPIVESPGNHNRVPLPETAVRSTVTSARAAVSQRFSRLLALPFLILAVLLAPLNAPISQARAKARISGKWVKISPPGVSTNPSSFNGGNFGFQAIAVDPRSGALYVGTCYQGLWKSANQGKSWVKINTGMGGSMLDSGRLWSLTIDPSNPQILYTTAGYGAGGILKSTDGGKDWADMISSTTDTGKVLQTEDVASIGLDPSNHNHVLASFHGGGNGPYVGRGPIIESMDGGATWRIHRVPALLGYPQYVHVLDTSSTWLLGSTSKGLWRTTDSGKTWTQVSREGVTDGGNQIYRAGSGRWYVAASGNVLRSTNNGRTWNSVTGLDYAAYMGIIGDGRRLYTQAISVGSGKHQYYYTSGEKNGRRWTRYNSQTFVDGPISMAYDPVRHIVYSSNWRGGVWKLRVPAGQ